MTAQQQLAKLNSGAGESEFFPGECAQFITDHGDAIAELIEAAQAYKNRPLMAEHDAVIAALRKLTQEATP